LFYPEEEYYVEMVCNDTLIKDVIITLKNAHPYEEPAYSVWRIETLETLKAK